jgi:hypothetical protein
VSSPLAAAHVAFVLIAWPWANPRRQDHTRLSFLGGSTNWTAPAAGLAAETSGDGKDPGMCPSTSLSEAFGRAERAISEVMHSPHRTTIVAPSCSAFHGLADDREIILRSADRGAQRSGGNGYGWAYSGMRAQDWRCQGLVAAADLSAREGAALTPRHF